MTRPYVILCLLLVVTVIDADPFTSIGITTTDSDGFLAGTVVDNLVFTQTTPASAALTAGASIQITPTAGGVELFAEATPTCTIADIGGVTQTISTTDGEDVLWINYGATPTSSPSWIDDNWGELLLVVGIIAVLVFAPTLLSANRPNRPNRPNRAIQTGLRSGVTVRRSQW